MSKPAPTGPLTIREIFTFIGVAFAIVAFIYSAAVDHSPPPVRYVDHGQVPQECVEAIDADGDWTWSPQEDNAC